VKTVGQRMEQEAADELAGGQLYDLLTVSILDPIVASSEK